MSAVRIVKKMLEHRKNRLLWYPSSCMLKIIIILYKKISGSFGRWVRNARKEITIKPRLQNNIALIKFLVSDCISFDAFGAMRLTCSGLSLYYDFFRVFVEEVGL